ncbi:MAG TPA: hypothetical protein VHG71_09145 [Verrucomicrobiae bacterium]|nr:hypothetical protein [Verrucomicrobiae bacterium]
MHNAALRTLAIYAICVPLALIFGYLLTGPLDYSTLGFFALLAFVLAFPILLKWHHPLLLFTWNFAGVLFFLPGQPPFWMALAGISLVFSILQRTLDKNVRLLNVPQITWPMLCLVAVVLVTAKFTGLGLRVFGNEVYGGKKYVQLLGAIVGYFALSVRAIPPDRRKLYVGLFFLAGVSSFIGDLISFAPRSLYPIFYLFPPNISFFTTNSLEGDSTRFTGTVFVSLAFFSFMLARYGIRGIFLSGKPWRWIFLILVSLYGLFGGFRGHLVFLSLIFILQFFLEGMHKTKLLPVFTFALLVGAVAIIPLASRLPYTFQRAISFLPLGVSQAAKADAQDSLEWRLKMWDGLLPQVPQYLWLGKGYVISPQDYNFVMGWDASVRGGFAEDQALALSDDFHNGPLSVIIPFGIWGVIAFLWFIIAGIWILHRNYRYGDPSLKMINTFLLAVFVARVIFFLFIFGGLQSDMAYFCGWLGLSVSLNGGVCKRAKVKAAAKPETPVRSFRDFSPAPAFQRRID